ncbi:hypothetical protein OPQ81_003354 [Rhizoctonia solani]|nr:hypothetical protein OPQ81_003354 [Rhizoctonia solani]
MDKIDQACLQVWSCGSPIRSASFSSDRKYVVLGNDSGRITVQDPHTGNQLAGFQVHRKVITSVCFSSDATLIVSSSHDYTLCVWNTSDGSLAYGPFKAHPANVNSASFSPDGMRLVSGSDDHTIRTWVTNDPSRCLLILTRNSAPFKYAVFSPDGLQIASCSSNRSVRIWDARSGDVLHHLRGHTRSVACVRYSPCGSFIFSGSNDGSIRMWNTRDGTAVGNPFKGHSDCVTSIAVSPEGDRIVSGSLDRIVCVWHRSGGELMASPFQGHTDSVRSVEFSADGARIISVSDDKTVRVWNAQGRTRCDAEEGLYTNISLIVDTAVSHDGALIAFGDHEGTIGVWNIQNATLETTWRLQNANSRQTLRLIFTLDDTHVLAAYRDGVLRMIDVQTGELAGDPGRFSPHECVEERLLALSPDGRSAVSAGLLRTALDIWDVQANQLVRSIEEKRSRHYLDAVFSSNGPWLATRDFDGVVEIWDRFTGQHIADFSCGGICPIGLDVTDIYYKFPGQGTRVYNVIGQVQISLSIPTSLEWNRVVFSPNGIYAAFIGTNVIGIYNIGKGELINEFQVPSPYYIVPSGITFVTNESCMALVRNTSDNGFYAFWIHLGAPSTFCALQGDGWALDENSNKVIWVPPEIRSRFLLASGSNIMKSISITVDYSDMLIGDKWSQCYIKG